MNISESQTLLNIIDFVDYFFEKNSKEDLLLHYDFLDSTLEIINSLYDKNRLNIENDGQVLQKIQSLNDRIYALRPKYDESDFNVAAIARLGILICDNLKTAKKTEDFIVLDRLYDTFMLLKDDYYSDTHGINEDLGISLGEAITFKKYNLQNKKHDSTKWKFYLKNDEEQLHALLGLH